MVWLRCEIPLDQKCSIATIGETLRPVQWLGSSLALGVAAVVGLSLPAGVPEAG